jgi:hypothetical protein
MVVGMSMAMPMMGITERCDANNIDHKPKEANDEQFAESMHFDSGCQAFDSFVDYLYAYYPGGELAW